MGEEREKREKDREKDREKEREEEDYKEGGSGYGNKIKSTSNCSIFRRLMDKWREREREEKKREREI